MSARLEGRVILVTGGASGIGRATALRLAREGAAVGIADRRESLAHGVAREITEQGGRAVGLGCDVTREAEVANAVEAVVRGFGRLTGLYANAGTAGAGWIHQTRLEDWQRVIDVNLTGTFLCAKHALPHLIAHGGGVVLTTGSIASVIVGGGGSAASYAASKGGVLQLTRQIAVDYADQGIRAVCLCPGAVRTNLGAFSREDRAEPAERLPRSPVVSPMKRAAAPEEIAAIAAFVFSDDASFITGSAIFADGGLTAI